MDIEERMRRLVKSIQEEEIINASDTFAERAEWYYQKRPQILALLQDLYSNYTTLLERSFQGKRAVSTTSALHEHGSSSISSSSSPLDGYSDSGGIDYWDAESPISSQQQQPATSPASSIDDIVTKLVVSNVDKDLLAQQVLDMEKQASESSRRTDLLKKLIEVLDSERTMLLNENVKLSYKVNALLEDNQELSSRALFLKRKADDLARCLVKIREDHGVYLLTRKIEDLQEQINRMEQTNKEQSACQSSTSSKGKIKFGSQKMVTMVGCFHFERMRSTKINGTNKNRVLKWWERVKNMDMFLCGHYSYT